MYPINAIIREEEEEENGEKEVAPSVCPDIIIQLRVAHDLRLEPRQRQKRHPG